MNSCGSTWRTSRSVGTATARAASITRSTSAGPTSRFFTATTPWLLKPFTCAPAAPAMTLRISQPAMSSASSTALRMAATVASMLTTVPLRSPVDAAVPMPVISTPPVASSATTTPILQVPTSSPTTSGFRFAIPSSRPRGPPRDGGVRAHDHLLREDTAHGRHLRLAAAPERQHPPEPRELLLEPAPAHLDRHARPLGEQREPAPRDYVDLGDGAETFGRARRQTQEMERPADRPRACGAVEIRRAEPGHVGQIAGIARADWREDPPARGEVVEARRPRVGEREDGHRPKRMHLDDHAPGQLPADARGADPRRAAKARLDRRCIDVPDAHARLDARGGADGLGGVVSRAPHDDLAHGEVRVTADRGPQRRPGGHGEGAYDHERGGATGNRGGRLERRAGAPAAPAVAAQHAQAPRAAAAHQRPISRTSGSSHTPLRSHTTRWAASMSAFTSAASAPPSFTMKFACFSEMCARPTRSPFMPAASTRRPA